MGTLGLPETPYWIIAFAYCIGMLVIGYWAYQRIGGVKDFLVGGHKLGLVVSVGTFGATFLSAGGFLGNIGFGYTNGLVIILWLMAPVLLGLVVSILLAARYRRQRFTTVPEFFVHRFDSRGLYIFTSFFLLVIFLVSVTAQYIGLGTLVSGFFGLDYKMALIIASAIVIIYTSAGGMIAVAYTDLVQFVILYFGLIYCTVHALVKAGGFTAVHQAAAAISTAPATGMAATQPGALVDPTGLGAWPLLMIVGYWFGWLLGVGVNPKYVVRIQSAKNVRTSIAMVVWMVGLFGLVYLFSAWLGLSIRVLVPTMPEGLRPDYAIIYYIRTFISPWVGGLILTAILAATMSTIDSELLVAAGSVSFDIIRFFKPSLKEETIVKYSRWAGIGVGVLATIFALNPPKLLLMVQAYAYGLIAAVFAVPFLLGLFWKKANTTGAIAGIAVSTLAVIVLQVTGAVKTWTQPVFPAVILGAIVMVVVSIFTRPSPNEKWQEYVS